MNMSKRTFLKATGAAAACTCLGGSFCTVSAAVRQVSDTPAAPAGSYRTDTAEVILDLGKIGFLDKIGGSVKLSLPDFPKPATHTKIIVVRTQEKTYRAFSDSCTHGGIELEYQHTERKLRCVSFGKSEFDMQGKVLSGFAKKPLPVYPVTLRDHELVLHIGEAPS